YLQKTFNGATADGQKYAELSIKEFQLNKEQERAFRIIANHANCTNPEQLQMYIGGMGGTGKSQILKSLIQFFEKRDEKYRFITVAPTGSAAALLGGSTYHSAFGINSRMSDRQLGPIKARLIGVEYIFLDEVSML
ncbi:hypothetical protein BJ165DRAFT_1319745, partial [Panaeolus papilionaceus]